MIHNAWLYTAGDPNQLRKDADDLETINQASVNAYMSRVNITEEALKEMMDAETWIAPADALEMGFATAIIDDGQNKKAAGQSVKKKLAEMIITKQKEKQQTIEPEPDPEPTPPEPGPDPEPDPDPEPQENKAKNFMAALFAKINEKERLN